LDSVLAGIDSASVSLEISERCPEEGAGLLDIGRDWTGSIHKIAGIIFG